MQNESGVRSQMTNNKVKFHDCPVDIAVLPAATAYNDSQYGDFVNANTSGQLERASNNPANLPYGLTLGAVMNIDAYPAFGGKYQNAVVVGVLSPNTEIEIPEINPSTGAYVQNTALVAGQAVALKYNSTTKRWGITSVGTGDNTRGYVVRVIRRQPQSDEPDYVVVRLV